MDLKHKYNLLELKAQYRAEFLAEEQEKAQEQQRLKEEAAWNAYVESRRAQQAKFEADAIAQRQAEFAAAEAAGIDFGLIDQVSPEEQLRKAARQEALGLKRPKVSHEEVIQERKAQGLLSSGKPAPVLKEDIVRKHSVVREDGVREITLTPRKIAEAPKGSRPVYQEKPQTLPGERGLKALKEHRPEVLPQLEKLIELRKRQAAEARRRQGKRVIITATQKRIAMRKRIQAAACRQGLALPLDFMSMSYEALLAFYRRAVRIDQLCKTACKRKPKKHRTSGKRRDDAHGQTLFDRKRPSKGSAKKRGGKS